VSLYLDRSGWQRVAFGDVIDSVTDRVDDPSKAGVDRYVGLEHLDPGAMTVQRWGTPDMVEAQKLRFQPGDVIFGRRRAYQKKVALVEFEGICSAHALVLRARPGRIDPVFLPIFLSSDYFLDRAIEISVGSLSPTVNWRDLKVQEFELPPLDEQKRIAALLWSIESSLITNQTCERTAETVRTALVRDRMSHGMSRDRLEDLIRAGTTITYGIVQAGPEVDDGVPYIRVSDMTDGPLRVAGMKRTTSVIADRFERSRVRSGDLVVALRGRTGLTRTVPDELDGANLTQGTARVSVDEARAAPQYVLTVLNSEWMAREISRQAKGSTFTELTLAALRGLPIPRLGNQAESDFLGEVERIDTAIMHLSFSVDRLLALRAAFMSEVFGGN
jgi:type I restriction enzyme S subunit